ncbi:hypothetical protein AAES_138136 [Amazona aestiva]|uniref:Uncharacterized protein n=1 Tax=Amazona aestiva TaxID=12930 RepID=A0A0Q3PIX4_AMAAE|nr:hypothetical protein AAES_138136 [Amazona aestiva]
MPVNDWSFVLGNGLERISAGGIVIMEVRRKKKENRFGEKQLWPQEQYLGEVRDLIPCTRSCPQESSKRLDLDDLTLKDKILAIHYLETWGNSAQS